MISRDINSIQEQHARELEDKDLVFNQKEE